MFSNQKHRLQSLIETEDPKAIPILIDCIGSNHQATVRFAAESIGVMAKKQKEICNIAVPELVDALVSENANIRKSILNTLLLLDIPLCYSGAIGNVVRGDNKPFNRILAKKIILNIMSNDSSVKYDNYSESMYNFKQNSVVYGEKQVTCVTSLIVNSVPSQMCQITDLNKDGLPNKENIELCEITNFVQNELANLSDQEQYVVKKHYGLEGESPCTLEKIAGVLGLTRDRVLQIHVNAIERFKGSALGVQLPDILSKLDIDEIWARLSSNGVIYKADVNRAFEKHRNGELLLVLGCCGKTVATWLSTIATEGELAWYRSSFSQNALAILLMKFEVLIKQVGMPLPLQTVTQLLDISENDAGALICLSFKYRVFEGFIIEGPIDLRSRRIVHLHQLLNSQTTFLSLHNLIALHNYQFPIELCTIRDAYNVMRETPHLFVDLGEKGWCSIGTSLNEKNYRTDPPITDNDVAQQTCPLEKIDDSNITSILTSILRKRGISSFKDIMTEFQDIAGNTYSSNSVGSTLSMRDDFVKFSPSIYGLSEHLKGFGISTSDLLLNDYDCQLFIMARYAGEAYGSFRLWNPVMEYKWYQWLEKRSNEKLRASFYFISTPEEWPVNKKSALELKDKFKKQTDTYYFLKKPHYYGSSLSDIRRIYALIRYAKDYGSLNWISANLVLGQRIDDYNIVVDIAFMICIGAVEPANNWQMLHKAKNDVKDIEKKLSNMLHCGQGADWKSPAGDFLMDAFTLNINVNDMGWVNVSFLNSLFHNAPKSASTVNDQASEPTEKSFSLVTGAVQLSSSSSTCDLVKNEAKTEKAVTYRSAQSKVNHAAVIILDDLKLDPVSHQVWRSGIEIELTQKEYALLLYLMRHPNIVLSRKKINDNVFESATDQTTNIIDVYVNYLRKKVDNDFPTKLIHTVRGKGYILRTLSGDCVSYIGINTGDELPENHTDPGRGEVIYFDDLKLDPVNHWVWRAEQRIQVTAKEYSLLLYFMLNPDVVVSREMIYDNVFEDAIDRSSNIVDVYVNYLRNKVDKNFTSKLIHTVRGKGYILMSDNVEYLEREINIETERNESIQPNTVFQHVETQNTKSSNRKYEPSNVDGNNNDKGTKTLDSIIEDFF